MQKKLNGTDILIVFIIIILIIISTVGVSSFNPDNNYVVTNQYGDNVKIFGSGIYAHDSYFKAPILIGSDCIILFLVVPMMIAGLINEIKKRTIKCKLYLTSITATVLYYATSIAFGVTYNSLHLLYIALFSSSLFAVIIMIKSINTNELRKNQNLIFPSKGLSIFLILSGISLFIAWLPDIIPSLIAGKSLMLIEIYTTEITYVLDMGIISPLMFICLYLLKKKDGLGDIVLSIVLTLCGIIGVMLPFQTLYQTLAGIVTPIPVLIIKVGIFVLLAAFSTYFNVKYYKNLK